TSGARRRRRRAEAAEAPHDTAAQARADHVEAIAIWIVMSVLNVRLDEPNVDARPLRMEIQTTAAREADACVAVEPVDADLVQSNETMDERSYAAARRETERGSDLDGTRVGDIPEVPATIKREARVLVKEIRPAYGEPARHVFQVLAGHGRTRIRVRVTREEIHLRRFLLLCVEGSGDDEHYSAQQQQLHPIHVWDSSEGHKKTKGLGQRH